LICGKAGRIENATTTDFSVDTSRTDGLGQTSEGVDALIQTASPTKA
jgi:hypothetical protein